MTTRGTAWPPAWVPNTGGPNLRGRRREDSHTGETSNTSLHNAGLHRCVPWPPLCATLLTKISFKQTKMTKLNEAKKCDKHGG